MSHPTFRLLALALVSLSVASCNKSDSKDQTVTIPVVETPVEVEVVRSDIYLQSAKMIEDSDFQFVGLETLSNMFVSSDSVSLEMGPRGCDFEWRD